MSVLVCGGGMTHGQVIGSTNKKGEHPHDRPLTPERSLGNRLQASRASTRKRRSPTTADGHRHYCRLENRFGSYSRPDDSGLSMRSSYHSAVVAVVALLGHVQANSATADDKKSVEIFLQSHCVRCHNEKKTEGKLNLDDMKIDVAANRANFAAILEQLRAGNMPPEDEPRPKPADVARITKWIQTRLAALPAAAANDGQGQRPAERRKPRSAFARYSAGKPGPSVPPPSRLWRLSPQGIRRPAFFVLFRSMRVGFLSRLPFARMPV